MFVFRAARPILVARSATTNFRNFPQGRPRRRNCDPSDPPQLSLVWLFVLAQNLERCEMRCCRTEIRELTDDRNMKANAAETSSADRGKRASSELSSSLPPESSASQVSKTLRLVASDKIQSKTEGNFLILILFLILLGSIEIYLVRAHLLHGCGAELHIRIGINLQSLQLMARTVELV
jgi:hypothetical protein